MTDPKPLPNVRVVIEEAVSRPGAGDNSDLGHPMGEPMLVVHNGEVAVSLNNFHPRGEISEAIHMTRQLLFQRTASGWALAFRADDCRLLAPAPIGRLPKGHLALFVNWVPQIVHGMTDSTVPQIWEFDWADLSKPVRKDRAEWPPEKPPTWMYRGFAVDGQTGGCLLLLNREESQQWSYRDGDGRWAARGVIPFPWGKEYDEPQPVRLCYPNAFLKGKAAYILGQSDVLEPYHKWREHVSGHTFDLRRLFVSWTPDLTAEPFRPWVEIASRDATGGIVYPHDVCVDGAGNMHLLWYEIAYDEGIRRSFFPDKEQETELHYGVFRDGALVSNRTLITGGRGLNPWSGKWYPNWTAFSRFHAAPNNRLFILYWHCEVGGSPDMRLLEVYENGQTSQCVPLALETPLGWFFTNSLRGGNRPSWDVHLMGQAPGFRENTPVRYALIRLEP